MDVKNKDESRHSIVQTLKIKLLRLKSVITALSQLPFLLTENLQLKTPQWF